MHIVFVRFSQPIAKLVEAIKKSQCGLFVVVKPELGLLSKFLEYTRFSTYKSFQREQPIARDFTLAWLCAIAGTSKIDGAMRFTAPEGAIAAIASEKPIDLELLGLSPVVFPANEGERKKAEQKLAKMYLITPAALANFALEELIIEKAATALL